MAVKLQEDMSHAEIDQDNVSLAAKCSWSRSLISPQCSRARICWAIIRSFLRHDTIAGGTATQSGRRFPNPSASRGRIFCGS